MVSASIVTRTEPVEHTLGLGPGRGAGEAKSDLMADYSLSDIQCIGRVIWSGRKVA